MQPIRYCLHEPILSVTTLDNHQECVYVPAGEVISVLQPDATHGRFVKVAWDSKTVLMFEEDLQDRAQVVQAA